MVITMTAPSVAQLPDIIDAVGAWQFEGSPMQVHPGDLGWYERFGPESLAAALRVWVRGEEPVAVGFLDESELIRMAIAPDAGDDEEVASQISDDFIGSLGALLPAGSGIVEARFGAVLQRVLTNRGWLPDDPWTPLYRDLSAPISVPELHVEAVSPDRIDDRLLVEAAAFPGGSLNADRWHHMASGFAYRNARCLVAYDTDGVAVASSTVWSAGKGRPGIIEPLGVHNEHRGRGFGVAMTIAAAHALRDMGSSSATVAAPSSNLAAVATYQAAGFVTPGEVTDYRRP